MKLNRFKIITIAIALFSMVSCLNDLDTKPTYEQSLENLLQNDPNAVDGLVGKLYASLSMSSAQGPGSSDVSGPDGGETVFLRNLWNLEDFTADAMKNRWGDDGLDQLTTTSNWNSSNKFFRYLYDRVYYTVPQANNLIAVLKKVNNPKKDQYISELRFIRALSYYYMIDCFGKGVLVTENDLGLTSPKPQSSRVELFNFVESELKEIEPIIAVNSGYGHANKASVQMLLARLYLNAVVYTGTAKYTEAQTYAKKVIDEGGFSLDTNFNRIFSFDNYNSPEIIFPLIADPVGTESYGNTTYIINGSTGGSPKTLAASDYGLTGDGWGGHRATKAWYGLFGADLSDYNTGSQAALSASSDLRSKLFWQSGHNYDMNDYKTWVDGYPSIKFTNLNTSGSTTVTNFSGADFPLFRLSDAYLIYAETVIRGVSDVGTAKGNALSLVNLVRNRSNATSVNQSDLTLDFILAERGRELNLEGVRRTDLIRFGKFTGGSYLWPWKGGVKNGTSIPSTYNLFPIPNSALNANPNLTQNPGY